MELEYGVTAWWTTEFYIDSQHTFGDGSVFTGTRWENRFRPLMREHWINPVLYVEFENITDADKTLKEVVGTDTQFDAADPNSEANRSHAHEIETKLILSSDYKGWNFSENFIGEKNLGHEPWEFGYALGVSRPLRLEATPRPCNFCRENMILGAEMYGGLGTVEGVFVVGHVSLRRADRRLAIAQRRHVFHFSRLRPERQQPPLPAALGNGLRNRRFRTQGEEPIVDEALADSHRAPFCVARRCCRRLVTIGIWIAVEYSR